MRSILLLRTGQVSEQTGLGVNEVTTLSPSSSLGAPELRCTPHSLSPISSAASKGNPRIRSRTRDPCRPRSSEGSNTRKTSAPIDLPTAHAVHGPRDDLVYPFTLLQPSLILEPGDQPLRASGSFGALRMSQLPQSIPQTAIICFPSRPRCTPIQDILRSLSLLCSISQTGSRRPPFALLNRLWGQVFILGVSSLQPPVWR